MKNCIVKLLLVLPVIFIAVTCAAQGDTTAKTPAKTSAPTIFTADSLASGKAKDVLASFFQLAFDQLTGPNKQLNFVSNPFAVMLKSDSGLNLDANYYKYRRLRKTNIGFGLRLDSNFHFNGFSSGVTYALINDRDTAASGWLHRALDDDPLGKERDTLQKELNKYARTLSPAAERSFLKMVSALFSQDIPFNKLQDSVRNKVKEIVSADPDRYAHIAAMVAKDSTSNLLRQSIIVFDSLKNVVKNGLLWTVGLSDTTYKDQFFFSNIVLGTEIVRGMGQGKSWSNIEFDGKAALNLLDDSLMKARNLKRALFSIEPGFNWVIRNRHTDKSWLEFAFSGAYSRNVSTLYPGEKRDSLTFNGTLRVRIINDIWIPLEIKYDPRSGNVFGFINIRVNFSALSNMIKSPAKKS